MPYPTEPRAKEARGKTPVSKTENCSGAGGWEKRKAAVALLRSAQSVPAGATSLQNSEGRELNQGCIIPGKMESKAYFTYYIILGILPASIIQPVTQY